MAPLLFRGVKLSCTSPASTATCTSIDHRRAVFHPGRALDRQTPHLIRDAAARRATRAVNSAPPESPSSNKLAKSHHLQKSRRSLNEKPRSSNAADLVSPSGSSRYLLNDDEAFFDAFPDSDAIPALLPIESARFHSAVKGDESAVLKPSSSSPPRVSQDTSVCFRTSVSSASSSLPPSGRFQSSVKGDIDDSQRSVQEMGYTRTSTSSSSSSCFAPSARFQDSPVLKLSSSTRGLELGYSRAYTSSTSVRFQDIIQRDEFVVLEPSHPVRSLERAFDRVSSSLSTTRFQPAVLKSSASARSRDQVVVLRVSLHCKGCEGKVRKHISRMEGVTSFNIDFATKKVTVIGDVTPLGVLSSISKVKNAQFWPSPPRSSSSS